MCGIFIKSGHIEHIILPMKFLIYLFFFQFVFVHLIPVSILLILFVAQVMSIISVLSLRSPENAARAIEAGAGDLAIQAMQKFPAAHQMQRNSCLMIRNLVVRNPENRQVYILWYNGRILVKHYKGFSLSFSIVGFNPYLLAYFIRPVWLS